MTEASAASPLLTFSPYETSRFGLRIFRGAPESSNAAALIDEIRNERVDVAIVRVREQAQALVARLCDAGLPSIVADTLVQYSADLHAQPAPSGAEPSLHLRSAQRRDAAKLEWMVRQIFAGYSTHYHANPLFDPARVLDGYAEWAVRHIAPNDEGGHAWIVEAEGEEVGFSCVEMPAGRGEARGVLNGVLPEKRSRGVYRRMLRAMLDHFANEGMRRFVISTQVHNTAVQRVWMAERFVLEHSENTVHINALLGESARRSPTKLA